MNCTLFFCLVCCYLIEVVLGSSSGVHNAELGYEAACGEVTRLTNRQFFLQFLPVVLCLAGSLFVLAQSFSMEN